MTFNDELKRKRKRNDELIKDSDILKDINAFKSFYRVKKIKVLPDEHCDTLLYYIKNNASIDIIDYIIINDKYYNLNKEYFYGFKEEEDGYNYNIKIEISPLAMAIKYNHLELANHLINLGADINFTNFNSYKNYSWFNSCEFFNCINEINIEYILKKGYIVTSKLIKWLIQNYKYRYLDALLKHLSSPISLKNFPKEKNKPLLRKSVYKVAIDNNNYKALSILYQYDPRNKKKIVNDIFDILAEPENRENFLKNIKNVGNQLLNLVELYSLFMDYRPWTPYDMKEIVFTFFKNDDYDGLKNFINKYDIRLTKMNIHDKHFSSKFDVDHCLKYPISPKLFNYIIDRCQSEKSTKELDLDSYLYNALKYNNFKIADYILQKYPNYSYELFYIWLYNNHSLTSRNLNFILFNSHEFKVTEDYYYFFYIKDCVRNLLPNRTDISILRKIFKYFVFNNAFVLKLLSFYQNKTPLLTKKLDNIIYQETHKLSIDKYFYEQVIPCNLDDNFINLFYEFDQRDKKIILNDLFHLFQINNDQGTKTNIYVNKIKNGVYKFPISHQMIYQLENCKIIRETILKLIHEGDVSTLEKYLLDNHISMDDLIKFNAPPYDFLCSTIDKEKPSLEMFHFILNGYQHNLNYFVWANKGIKKRKNESDIYTCPLSCALAHHHYSIAEILMDHGADINYESEYNTVFEVLHENHQLSCSNVKFMLQHGLKVMPYMIGDLINFQENIKDKSVMIISLGSYSGDSDNDFNHENENPKDKNDRILLNNKIMETLFKYYIFDNIFIIQLLTTYKNKIPLSNKELNNIIGKEINKISTDYRCHYGLYYQAIKSKDYHAIDLIVKNDFSSVSVFKDINLAYDLITKAIENDNIYFIEKIINSNLIDYNQFDVKQFYSLIDHTLREVQPISENNNNHGINNDDDLCMIEDKIEEEEEDYDDDRETFSYCSSGSGNYYYNEKMKDKKGLNIFINSLIIKDYINFETNDYETVFAVFLRKLNVRDMKFFITKSFQSKTFSYEKINGMNILYQIMYLFDYQTRDELYKITLLFLKTFLSHKQFDYTKLDMNKCIRFLLTLPVDSNFSIIDTLLKELMKNRDFNSDVTIKNEIIRIISIADNKKLITLSKNILFNQKKWDKTNFRKRKN